ncbi:MAG: hypothetical protein B7Y36_08380 [Novosphingobium sp. 28-62-57]|uniref:hypothetical protein n=1 Tax=unclassified Novosphingobium TaxID=2644732 RepID=UPI000BD2254F|nr:MULTISPECIES: hypothetical protein [unclassified Novosphingobium]OYW47940.1 MAG: hypothetical protein B7Z36_01470 [Novosphingobium sp. 12-63-9]OYZ10833.1 MAG: hypothetical protein B7Y36_08380 [Novosphingobium sp. 28-62-57]OZA32846.1 MAG: hypothetical protein B7X92_12090 [Novosphingobium sp. 17-62-9]HQS70023.1 hypothetical protein [Novosphingobium sp.]
MTNPERRKFQKERGFDPDLDVSNPGCLIYDGTHYCAATESRVVSRGSTIIILFSIGGKGLAIHLTPEGARQMGEDLVRIAETVGATHAAAANAQLAATLAKKG